MNLTRLPCVPSVGCAVGSIEDNDQFIALGDGSNLVGAGVGDGVYDGHDGVGNASVLRDLGDTAEKVPGVGVRLFDDSGYPDMYSSFDVFITINTSRLVSSLPRHQ